MNAPAKTPPSSTTSSKRLVLPLYEGERAKWIAVIKGAISKDGSTFTAQRVIRRYAADAYTR